MPHSLWTVSHTVSNSSNVSINFTSQPSLIDKALLSGLMGWDDIEAHVHEYRLLDQSTLQALKTAESQFHSDPTIKHRSQFKTALRRALREVKDLEQHCLTQQAHYQDLLNQELSAQHQPQNYFASWTGWVIDGVKYFFGSDNAALVEKYQQAVLKQRELQTRLQAVLDEVSLSSSSKQDTVAEEDKPVASVSPSENDRSQETFSTQRRLLSTNDTVTTKKIVSTQIVEPGDVYDYTINGTEIFEGNFSYLDVTTADGKPFPEQLVATDSHGGYVGAPFLLQVTYFPEVVGTIPAAPLLRPGKSFNFTIPAGVFRDLDDPVLQYNASLANGAALPAWLQFDANTLTLTGTPTTIDEGELDVVVVARDAQGGTAQAPITLSITPNFAPRARTPVSNQVAEVGNAFSLFVGPDAFTDENGDVLIYRATQVGGASLPSWLTFDALRVGFTGTPGRGDTNTYSDRVITVDLSASDGIAAPAHTVFNINVRGTSWLALAIQIGAPILSALTTAYGVYKNRSLFLNRYKPNRYQRVTDNHPKPGEHFARDLNAPAEQIYGFATQIPRHVPAGWRRALLFSYRPLPGVTQLPTWLVHDRASNCLRSIKPVPEGLAGEILIIQVLGKGNVILEEFKLSVEKAYQDGLEEDRQDTGIEMMEMPQRLLAS